MGLIQRTLLLRFRDYSQRSIYQLIGVGGDWKGFVGVAAAGEPLALKPRQRPFLQRRCLRRRIPEGLQRRCDRGQGDLSFEARRTPPKGRANALDGPQSTQLTPEQEPLPRENHQTGWPDGSRVAIMSETAETLP